MTFQEACETLENIKYKKGWSFNFLRSPFYDQYELKIYAEVPDAYNLNNNTLVHRELITPYYLECFSKEQFIHFIKDIVTSMEYHELNEFFEYKNVKIFDPHKSKEELKKIKDDALKDPPLPPLVAISNALFGKGGA